MAPLKVCQTTVEWLAEHQSSTGVRCDRQFARAASAQPEVERVRKWHILDWLFGKTPRRLSRHLRFLPILLSASSTDPLLALPINRSVVRNFEKLAIEHDVGAGAVAALAAALSLSQGRAAQFSHPELGGMGQWLSGGMLMIGDMFNHDLKAKVNRLCHAGCRSDRQPASSRVGTEGTGERRSDWLGPARLRHTLGSRSPKRYALCVLSGHQTTGRRRQRHRVLLRHWRGTP